MKFTFYGACKMVTGSCYLIEHKQTKILIDCGMIQGEHFTEHTNYEPFSFNPAEIDYLLLTHAHIDHCGRVPKLVHEGFKGKIIATYATLELAALMLADSAHVITQDAKWQQRDPLYTLADVQTTTQLFQGTPYHQPINLGESTVQFYDAGHILGSSFIALTIANNTIVFSGDLGNPPVPLLLPTESLCKTDYLVMESTYGGRVHEPVAERKLLLCSAIYETITLGGTLLIPAFALERTQEILYELNSLVEQKKIPPVPIFIDSPLAIKATAVYKQYQQLFNAETKYLLSSGDDIFKFKGLKFTATREESKQINHVAAPKVIVAGSGMMQGGRIRYHLLRYLADFKNQVLIVGYQVAGSLGRQLLNHAKTVSINGETIVVQAKIKAIGAYSAHADQLKLLHWLTSGTALPKQVWLTHGEPEQATALASAIQQYCNTTANLAEYGQTVEL